MTDQFTPAQIAEAKARLDLVALLEQDGHQLQKEGRLHRLCCPFHDERTPSCIVDEAHSYHCFGCSAHGDAISYLIKARGRTFVEVVRDALQLPEPAQRPKVNRARKYVAIMPPPAKAAGIKPTFRHPIHHDPTAVWWYLSAEGERLMADARYEYPADDGTIHKDVVTWCWARSQDGSEGWTMTRPESGIPLYGLDRLAGRTEDAVIIAEGCKSADGAQRWLPDLVAMAWCGGTNSAEKAQRHAWASLSGRRIWLWPDMDLVGVNAMRFVLDHLRAVGAEVLGVIGAPDYFGRKKGWDAADATAEEALRLWQTRSENPEAALRRLADALPVPMGKDGTPKPIKLHPALARADQEPVPVVADDDQVDAASEPPADPPAGQPTPAPADDNAPDEAGDMEAASRFVAMHGTDLRFCPTLGRSGTWFIWDGKRFRPDIDGEIIRRAEITARTVRAELRAQADQLYVQAAECDAIAVDQTKPAAERQAAPERAKRLRGSAGRLQAKGDQACNVQRLENMLFLARSRAGIPIAQDKLDGDPWLINCNNGVLDLRSKALWKHDRKYLCTRLAPVDWKANATHPFLKKVLAHLSRGDAAVERFLQDALGATISGDNRHEHFFLVHGHGRDGKGALFRGIKAALGDYATTAASQTFLKLDGQRIRNDLARLTGFHLVISAEVEKGSTLDVTVMKALSGGDDVIARFLHNEEFEYRPKFTIWLQTNDKPILDAADDAIWERLICIPVGRKIEAHERDPRIKAVLGDPAVAGPAILAWLAEGAHRMAKVSHLTIPSVVREATADYRRGLDLVGEFVRDHLLLSEPDAEPDKRAICTVKDMTADFLSYCSEIGVPKGREPIRRLRDVLTDLGCTTKASRLNKETVSKCWIGVTLVRTGHACESLGHKPNEEKHFERIKGCNRISVRLQESNKTVTDVSDSNAKTSDPKKGECNQVTADARTRSAPAPAHARTQAHDPVCAVTRLHDDDDSTQDTINKDTYTCNQNVTNSLPQDVDGYSAPPASDTNGSDPEAGW